MKAELLKKALEADPTLRETWEKAVQTMYKTELEKIDCIRKRGSGKYVNITIQAGWEGFVSGYLLAMECIRIESESVEENLEKLGRIKVGDEIHRTDGKVMKVYEVNEFDLIAEEELKAGWPTSRGLWADAIKGGATVVLAGGE